MRILVVADHYRHGVSRVVEERAAALARRGHSVTLLAGSDPESLDSERTSAVLMGLNPRLVPREPSGRGPESLRKLLRAFRDASEELGSGGRFDAVLHNQPLSAWALSGSGPLRAGRTIYTFHSPWAAEWAIVRGIAEGEGLRAPPGLRARIEFSARRWIERRALERADRIAVLSEYMRSRLLLMHPGVDPRKVERVPGGVDLSRFRPSSPGDRRVRKASLGISPDARLLLTVRRLVPRMGLENLLHAFRRLRGEFPDLELVIGGAGPLLGPLDAQARTLGLEAHVRFLGFVPEASLPGLYAAADLFVLPTRELEGFGLATIEALASGTPVVGTPVGATPEILSDIDRRLLANDVTPEGLSSAIKRALRLGPEALRNLGAAARRRVAASYSSERIGDALERILLGREAGSALAGGRTSKSAAGTTGRPIAGRERRPEPHLASNLPEAMER